MRFSSFTYLVGQGLHNLRANKMMTFASMGVLTVCMVLVGAAFMFGANVSAMVDYIGEQNQTVAFMDKGLSEEDFSAADAAIRSIPHVAAVEYISEDEMLAQYSEKLSGYTNLQEMFQNDNPLHANYVVRADDAANIGSIAAALEQVPGVIRVNSVTDVSDLFVSLRRAVNYICYGLVAVLALVSVVVISNTIKITVFNRRKEIGIMKLVGATNSFIRFPFFVEGVTSGLVSAAVASGVVCGAYYALCRWYAQNPSSLSMLLGGTLVPLENLWYYIVIGFALFGFVLCGIGTATSIRKHLKV
ncbi:MAG: permease-like cell division protein FtsX [Oscillospiraceae bacterium]|nr:permease-like cell division protein FtsX [Oscillospiraceae bacterium]